MGIVFGGGGGESTQAPIKMGIRTDLRKKYITPVKALYFHNVKKS
jgi:hypothetical protein